MKYQKIEDAVYRLTSSLKDDVKDEDLVNALEYLFDELGIGYDELPEGLHEIFQHKRNENYAMSCAIDAFNDNNDL